MEEYKKKYEDALERARQIHNEGKAQCFDVMTKVFPELADSKEDRIRKGIFKALSKKDARDVLIAQGIEVSDALAWLEKQGEKNPVPDWMPKFLDELRLKKNYFDWDEHRDIEGGILAIIKWMTPNYFNEKDGEPKPADEKEPTDYNSCDPCFGKPIDKREPKFKVGDWVVDNCGYTWKIERILNQFYLLEGVEGGESRPTIEWVNTTFHLWTIADAKPGDVLAAHECIVLFKEIDGLNIKCHCTYHFMNNPSFYVNTLQNKSAFHPATKEQRKLLFQKMQEAGYKWDVEKRELKKIPQKPTWSKEDEHRIKDIIYFLNTAKKHYASTVELDACIDWLKSLRQRIGE